jgi:hypothetical protein
MDTDASASPPGRTRAGHALDARAANAWSNDQNLWMALGEVT